MHDVDRWDCLGMDVVDLCVSETSKSVDGAQEGIEIRETVMCRFVSDSAGGFRPSSEEMISVS